MDRAGDAVGDRLADEGGDLVVGRREPIVLGVVGFLPVEPDLPGLVGQQVDLGEAVRAGEPQRPLADQQAMPGALHDQPGDGRRVHDVADRGHRAAAVGRPVHDGGVQLDDAVLIGQTAQAHRVVLGIGLDDRHPLDRRVERVVPFLTSSIAFSTDRKPLPLATTIGFSRRPA